MVELFPRFTQDTRLLRITTPLGTDKLLVECLRGEESLSNNFCLDVSLLSTDAHIPLKSLLGQPALLELLTASAEMKWRPFHGYVTSAKCVGANGGVARYTVTIEPWTAFLQLGRDSRMFQDKTVFQILDGVFESLQGKGRLAPRWRYDIADRSIYPSRSLTCQYQESDYAFAERLMHEEGLFYYFEHSPATNENRQASHTLVIADHNGAFRPNTQAEVRFTQPGAVMREDSVDRWRITTRSVVGATSLDSWDYRSMSNRPVEASTVTDCNASGPASRDTPGTYGYPTRARGQRIVDNHLQAMEVTKEQHTGAGTVRTFAPGTTFALRGHAHLEQAENDDGRTFAITRVVHSAHNNLSAELRSAIAQALGPESIPKFGNERQDGLYLGTAIVERPLYRNRIDAIRNVVPYRSSGIDGHGTLLHPKPTVKGQQTAIVVGPPGAVIHTDRDHRIKVQFHWQRNSTTSHQSHSRLDHPTPNAQIGAPADDRSCTWVRVASTMAAIAGANWGAVAIPRVGTEVLIDFLDGDIDRPVVIGALYNGKGNSDAQHSSVVHGAGIATGNAASWFPGETGAHAHPAVLSGIKTQGMGTSQDGNGAYNQLVFDDSAAQSRLALQSHMRPHAGTAELNLGHLRHQTDNQRLHPVGFGAELKTAHSAALRAGKGLLLSTDARAGANGDQLDAREAQAQNEESKELQSSMVRTAKQHNAVLEPFAELLAISAMETTIDILKNVSHDGATHSVAAFNQPHFQLSSPAGIVMSTSADAIFAAGSTTGIAAGQDVNLGASGNSAHAVKEGITLFTYGKAHSKDKPNQETGVKLHAASGKLSSQSQSGATRLTADKAVTVASVNKNVRIAAAKHVLLTAQGACLKLEGGNIMLHAPGKVDFKASMREVTGPADGSISKPDLPKAKEIYNEAFVVMNEETKQPMANVRYRLESASGVVVEGITDTQGRTQRIFTAKREELTLHLPTDE
ncbi:MULTISPECIES: type VI secretion system Vgr family protein [unclassified Massilia]|uniref:type VI secretion system Vgr family protein n=1 Tax=unclassified Massilia TaxID=2609279 RepID=UPI0017861065|nr:MULTISPECIES: type VI secretion system Vgr family protein [unclassified Massilia]MBD8531778.1 type VI secretion system tip protein VgrG [Massilia sp. CFBP 13647]MBD8675223.1 type VI secretion system tip protein VgrG [Massilia sp. CFBP 13721]